MTWTKPRGKDWWVADWERGTMQVCKRASGNREIAEWKFEIFEGGKLIDSGWAFTKSAAPCAAEIHVPRLRGRN